jgi:PAS domain S-box-containing protein
MSGAATREDVVLALDVFESADATFSTDSQQRIVAWNDAAERLFGYRADEVVGAYCCDILRACSGANCRYCLQMLLPAGRIRAGLAAPCFEIAALTRDGSEKHVHVSTVVARARSGGKRLVHICHDDAGHPRQGERVELTPPGGGVRAPAVDVAAWRAHPTSSRALTSRECEVLRHLARGRRTAEIAAALDISPLTARNHVLHAMDKLGAHTRLEAIMLASRKGLI